MPRAPHPLAPRSPPSSVPRASVTADTPTPDALVAKPMQTAGGGPGVEIVAIPGDPRSITRTSSPGDDLSEQVNDLTGRSEAPAKGGRPLVAVKSTIALDASTLDVAEMEFDFVLKGQASVKRCFAKPCARRIHRRGAC